MEKNISKDANSSQESNQYKIRGRLDLTGISDLDKDLPIRVSAVRGDSILSSEIIDLQERKDRKINFDLEFQLPGPRCGVNLLVSRGDLQESKTLSLEAFKHRVSAAQWKESKKGRNPFTANIGNIVIEDRIYKRWLFLCRKYTIRGKVVCRDSYFDQNENRWVFVDTPVPGATVEAYDVDCWWWWCFKDLIGTAVTEIDGTFEMTFTWCCRTWFPFPAPWTIDPGLLERIRELLATPRIPIPLPDPPPDPFEFQEYLTSLVESTSSGAMNAFANANQVAALPQSEVSSNVSAQRIKALLPPAPDLEALHVWPWWHRRDCSPDVLFKVTQPCGGEVQIVYEEGTDQTRWNIPQTMSVTLEANEKACCVPSQPEPPCGDCLGITQVGCTDVTHIGLSAGPPDLRGYAYPGNLDRPFGDRLVIRGEFGEDAHDIVDFYRVEYHKDGMAPGTWNDMGSISGLLGGISRKYLDPVGFPPPYQSPPVNFGPMDVDGMRVYKTKYKFQRDDTTKPPGFDWIWTRPDYLFIVNSENLPEGDGLYTFRIVGYRMATDGSLVDERVMPLCGIAESDTPSTVMVRIDNRNMPHPASTVDHPCGPDTVHRCTAEPDCDFVSIIKNEGGPGQVNIAACDDVTIADTDTVTIHFKATTPATDKDGHLLAYELTAHYGESGLVRLINVFPNSTASSYSVFTGAALSGDPTPEYGPTYNEALTQGSTQRPHWHGGSFKIAVPGTAFPVSCAYQLRLRTWKRTFRGCNSPHSFHWNVCEYSFCVVKPE